MDRRNFVTLGVVSGAAGLLLPAALQAADASPLLTPFAGGIYYTKEKPGRWAAKAMGHSPVVESSGRIVMVTTPHEMKGYEHYIVKHVLLDANMNVLGEKLFNPLEDKAPVSQFEIEAYTGPAYALSMCNQHDLWVTAFTL